MMTLRAHVAALLMTLLLAACGNEGTSNAYQGYVEGEYLYLAAPSAGYLNSLDAVRGSRVTAGTQVFSIAPDPELHGLHEAEARAASAKEKVQNLQQPRRPPEVASMEAQLRAAQAALQLSEVQLKRQEALQQKGFVSKASLDEARTARDRDAAAVEAARQQLATFRINLGRQPEVRGAQADVAAAGAQVARQRWQVEKMTVTAPAAGEVSETYYRPGEWVPAGQPVASLLPDERRRIRFFVPETVIAGIHPGQHVEASCDGCKAPLKATITFVAPQAEYTPPVIYSRGAREKLVFRVEAQPTPEQAAALRPGLPMDVRLVGN